jgi:hypothetical protein
MREIALSRITKLNDNIKQLLELLTGLTNSPNVLSIISETTLTESMDRILNYYMFLISYIKIKTQKDKTSSTLIYDYVITLNYLFNEYSMNIGYIIYLKNNLTTNTFLFTKVLDDELIQASGSPSDIQNTSYLLVLSEDYEKISSLLDELYSYVKIIIESNVTSLPEYFSKYKKTDPDRFMKNYILNGNTIQNKFLSTNNIIPNPFGNNLQNINKLKKSDKPNKLNNVVYNKNKCDNLNISSLIDCISTYTRKTDNTSTYGGKVLKKILKKNNKKINDTKTLKTTKSQKIKKNKKRKILINNILLISVFVLICIYKFFITKYQIKISKI